LAENGLDHLPIDRFVIDGWVGVNESRIISTRKNKQIELSVAPYHESTQTANVLESYVFQCPLISDSIISYESYTHVGGHVLAAYYTSPFHIRGESSLILVWDGGMYPRLYYYNVDSKKVINYGSLFNIGVNIYSIFAQYFRPFKINENVIKDELSIAGKVMAYVAYGKVNDEIIHYCNTAYQETINEAADWNSIPNYPHLFARTFKTITKGKAFQDEDILTSFHFFLEKLLLNKLASFKGENICLSGGSALNIKWNASIRNSNLFKEVWIPPFPNDSGSAIGTGLCSLHHHNIINKENPFEWDVYSGPKLRASKILAGWKQCSCSIERLANFLIEENEPIIFLTGNAELGPRALGNRSMLVSPVKFETKAKLNYLKMREYYRPIAPICMEEHANSIFDPGTPDRYMLFEHTVRPEWKEKIPAVLHFDNTARLQTVSQNSHPVLYSLLKAFYDKTGIPVLCNTSANLKGCGFFPDVISAMKWGQAKYIWSENTLYTKD
jgi:carbamoyltransferase